MRVVVGLLGVGKLPDWIPADSLERLTRKGLDPLKLNPRDNEDMFSPIEFTWTDSVKRHHFSASHARFSDILTTFGFQGDEFCNNFVDTFFVNRPVWFIPSRAEVHRIRETCFPSYLSLFTDSCLEESEECNQFLGVLDRLGTGIFSSHTEWVLSLAPSSSPALTSQVGKFIALHPVIGEAIKSLTNEEESDEISKLISMLQNRSSDHVLHVSDYLDRFGMQPYTLALWKEFLAIDGLDYILTREFRKRSDMVIKPSSAQAKRFRNFRAGRGTVWSAQFNGIEFTMSVDNELYMACSSSGRKGSLSFRTNKGELNSFFRTMARALSEGNFGKIEGSRNLTVVLYLIKLGYDPLGSLVHEISHYKN